MRSIKEILEYNLVPVDFKIRSRYITSLAKGLKNLERTVKAEDSLSTNPDIIQGSIIDLLLTEGKEAVLNKYFISKQAVPTDKTKEFVDAVFNKCGSNVPDHDTIVSVAREMGFGGKSYKDNTIIEKYSEWLPYAAELRESIGKPIIDNKLYEDCEKIVNAAQTHPTTAYLFNSGRNIYKPLLETDITEILKLFMKDIKFSDEFKLFALSEMDFIHIDDENKLIYPIEVKSYSNSLLSSYYEYRYYYQIALYNIVLVENMRNNTKFVEEHNIAGYKTKFPLILGLNKDTYSPPRLYEPSRGHVESVILGGKIGNYATPIKGLVEMMFEVLWQIVNNEYDYKREVCENNYIEIIE